MALEPKIHALWAAKQTAKGNPAAAATKRLVQVGGDINTARADGSEQFSDLSRFGDAIDYTDTLVGAGDPVIEAHPDQLAYLCWLFFGQETVTGAADPFSHEFTPGTNGGFWATFWKRVGQTVGPVRQKFNDCRIGTLAFDGSQGSKVLHVTPTILSLDPGEVFAADPAAGMPGDDSLLFTEAEGTFEVNGVVLKVSSFQLVCNEDRSPWYGDGVTPADVVEGTPSVTLAVTGLIDAAGLAEYNKRIYGTAAPAAGTKPLKVPEDLGSFECLFTKEDDAGPVAPARSAKFEVPGVKWSPDVAVPPNVAGGAAEITLAGEARRSGSDPQVRITIENGNAAYAA